jgi:hypothetical protein
VVGKEVGTEVGSQVGREVGSEVGKVVDLAISKEARKRPSDGGDAAVDQAAISLASPSPSEDKVWAPFSSWFQGVPNKDHSNHAAKTSATAPRRRKHPVGCRFGPNSPEARLQVSLKKIEA